MENYKVFKQIIGNSGEWNKFAGTIKAKSRNEACEEFRVKNPEYKNCFLTASKIEPDGK